PFLEASSCALLGGSVQPSGGSSKRHGSTPATHPHPHLGPRPYLLEDPTREWLTIHHHLDLARRDPLHTIDLDVQRCASPGAPHRRMGPTCRQAGVEAQAF